MREKLVGAIKNGQTLLLRLTDALPDLVATYAHDNSFPTCQVFECVLEEIDDEVAEQHFGGFGGQVGSAQSAGVAEVITVPVTNGEKVYVAADGTLNAKGSYTIKFELP